MLRDGVDRLAPVRALRHDLEIREGVQAQLEPAAGERLVVDDDRANPPGHQTSSGSRISTERPGDASATSIEWESP